MLHLQRDKQNKILSATTESHRQQDKLVEQQNAKPNLKANPDKAHTLHDPTTHHSSDKTAKGSNKRHGKKDGKILLGRKTSLAGMEKSHKANNGRGTRNKRHPNTAKGLRMQTVEQTQKQQQPMEQIHEPKI